MKFIKKKEEKSKKPRKVTVIFGDDLKFMKSLYNGSVTSNEQQEQVCFFTSFFRNISKTPIKNATHFISQNSPSDDFVYSKKNCDVVLISGKKVK